MGDAQRFEFGQVIQVFLFTATPVDGDITVGITRQGGQQNGAHVGETCTTGNQDQRTVFIIAQPRITVRNIHHDLALFQNAVHDGHRIQVKL